MSENLSSQPIETQSWQRELPLHHELDGRLKPDEAIALIGSFTETSLEAHRQDYETGELNEQSFGVKQRIHSAALEQLATLTVDDGSVLDAIVDRGEEVEVTLKAPHGGTRSRAEELALREQLEGVKLLNKMYLNVEDTIANYAQTQPGDANKHNPRNRAAAINEVITWHNERVSHGTETYEDIPETHEAQSQPNASNAEHATRPQPTVTVDDARHKVAEALGGNGEKEREALIGEVAQVAKGTTRIFTDMPRKLEALSQDGRHTGDGFGSFGDGIKFNSTETVNEKEVLKQTAKTPEAMSFTPDTVTRYKTVIKHVETGKLFSKRTEQVEEQVPDGEVPVMVINPATGQQEPGVKVAYQFNTSGSQYALDSYEGKVPEYKTESGRAGNILFVAATLPKSVADKLQQEVSRNPKVAREFAKTLAGNNGVTDGVWNESVCPPYDMLPDNWQFTITNP